MTEAREFVKSPPVAELAAMSDLELRQHRYDLADQETRLVDMIAQPGISEGRLIRLRDARRYTIGSLHVAKQEYKRRHRASAEGAIVDAATAWAHIYGQLTRHEAGCYDMCGDCDHFSLLVDLAEDVLRRAVNAKYSGDARLIPSAAPSCTASSSDTGRDVPHVPAG